MGLQYLADVFNSFIFRAFIEQVVHSCEWYYFQIQVFYNTPVNVGTVLGYNLALSAVVRKSITVDLVRRFNECSGIDMQLTYSASTTTAPESLFIPITITLHWFVSLRKEYKKHMLVRNWSNPVYAPEYSNALCSESDYPGALSEKYSLLQHTIQWVVRVVCAQIQDFRARLRVREQTMADHIPSDDDGERKSRTSHDLVADEHREQREAVLVAEIATLRRQLEHAQKRIAELEATVNT